MILEQIILTETTNERGRLGPARVPFQGHVTSVGKPGVACLTLTQAHASPRSWGYWLRPLCLPLWQWPHMTRAMELSHLRCCAAGSSTALRSPSPRWFDMAPTVALWVLCRR